jgi:hypothetical protein
MAAADLQPMVVAPRAPGEYAPAAGVRAVERLQEAAEPLRGARVLHVSVAGAEGRVPELLGGLLPLAAGAGLKVEWRVLFGTHELRATAAALQSGLRGGESGIDDAAWAEYLEACEQTAGSLRDDYDAIVLHDAALGPRGYAPTRPWLPPTSSRWSSPRARRASTRRPPAFVRSSGCRRQPSRCAARGCFT